MPSNIKISGYSKLLLITIFTIEAILFYSKPYFSHFYNPDECFHLQRVIEFSENLTIKTDYPFLLYIIGGISYRIGGLLAFRVVLLLISTLITFLLYYIVKNLFNPRIAFFTTFLYTLSLNSALEHLFRIGTYANIIGDFFALLIIYFVYAKRNYSKKTLLICAIIGALAPLTHTLILVTVSYLILPLIIHIGNKKIKTSIVLKSMILLIAFALSLLLYPNIISRSISYSKPLEIQNPIIIESAEKNLADYVPEILYPLAYHFNLFDWRAFLAFLGLTIMIKRKDYRVPSFLLWMILFSYTLYIFSRQNIWRIDLEMLPVKAILAGYFTTFTIESIEGKLGSDAWTLRTRKAVATFVLFSIIFLSVNPAMIIHGITYWHKRQVGIYDSIIWIRNNFKNVKVLSLAILEYRYIQILAPQVKYLGAKSPNMTTLEKMAKKGEYDLLVVFRWEYRYPKLKKADYLKEIYNDDAVAIFKVIKQN